MRRPLVIVAAGPQALSRVKRSLEALRDSVDLVLVEDSEEELTVYVPPASYRGREAIIVLEQMARRRTGNTRSGRSGAPTGARERPGLG